MRHRLALASLLAASPSHVVAQAAVVEETAKAIGSRVANDAPIMVVVVLLVVGGFIVRDHFRDARRDKDREEERQRHEATIAKLVETHAKERERHEAALGAALDKFIVTIERSAGAAEKQTAAIGSLRDAIAEMRDESAVVGAEMRNAIAKSDTNFTEIRAAVFETRDAQRAGRAGR